MESGWITDQVQAGPPSRASRVPSQTGGGGFGGLLLAEVHISKLLDLLLPQHWEVLELLGN